MEGIGKGIGSLIIFMAALLVIILFTPLMTYAGEINLNWTHTSRDTANHFVHIHKWKLYFGREGSALNESIIFVTPPPLPVTADTLKLHYKNLLVDERLVSGRYCFELTAITWLGTAETESVRSNRKCETVGVLPNAPTDIEIEFN